MLRGMPICGTSCGSARSEVDQERELENNAALVEDLAAARREILRAQLSIGKGSRRNAIAELRWQASWQRRGGTAIPNLSRPPKARRWSSDNPRRRTTGPMRSQANWRRRGGTAIRNVSRPPKARPCSSDNPRRRRTTGPRRWEANWQRRGRTVIRNSSRRPKAHRDVRPQWRRKAVRKGTGCWRAPTRCSAREILAGRG
jgi:hypothetical protein